MTRAHSVVKFVACLRKGLNADQSIEAEKPDAAIKQHLSLHAIGLPNLPQETRGIGLRPTNKCSKHMAVSTNTTATGASGTTYTLEVHPLGTQFRAVSGVYVVCKGNTPLYVGQTGNLAERFEDHHKTFCWRSRGADRMAVMAVSGGETHRLAIERDLIQSLNPPCNG